MLCRTFFRWLWVPSSLAPIQPPCGSGLGDFLLVPWHYVTSDYFTSAVVVEKKMCFFVCANIIPAFVYVQCGHLFFKCHTSIFYVLCGHLTRVSSALRCSPHWTHTLVTIFLSSHRLRYDLWFSCTSHNFLSESSIVVLISITNMSKVIS